MVAAAHAPQDDTVIDALASKLLDADSSLPLKYRVLFSLRNLPGEQARAVLAEGESFAVFAGRTGTHVCGRHALLLRRTLSMAHIPQV